MTYSWKQNYGSTHYYIVPYRLESQPKPLPHTPIPTEVLITGSVKSINHSGISSLYCDASSTATETNTMRTPADVLANRPRSNYQGSEKTLAMVKEQVKERWGIRAANSFDPYHDAMTATAWFAAGFKIKRGEKALRSITFIETEDDSGNLHHKVRRGVNLFHKRQVHPAS